MSARNEMNDSVASMSIMSVGNTSVASELLSPREYQKMTVEQSRNFKPMQMNENKTRLNGYLQASVNYWDEVDDSLAVRGLT